jgi:sugar phosphate permease
MGLTYAFLYMGRYNLTVAKNALGSLMTKEDFGWIFGVGTLTYAFAFLLNGPLTDKFGGKKALLLAAFGASLANLSMGVFLSHAVSGSPSDSGNLKLVFSILYAINMYFQSFGAVAIVKVNSSWFHVRERGSFSGIFGTMISSGIFFAFTVNQWMLRFAQSITHSSDAIAAKWVFFFPAALLAVFGIIELFVLRDRPGQAGHEDFDTGDASSGETGDLPVLALMKKILTHPVILTLGMIEFCTGVLRNGIMHWYPIYSQEILALPSHHHLANGEWKIWYVIPFFGLGFLGFLVAKFIKQPAKRWIFIGAAMLCLLPFLQAGWGGLLMVAGILGGNIAGQVSDLFFQSRRAPAAGGLYAVLILCTLAMIPSLGNTTTVVQSSPTELQPGDKVLSVNGSKTQFTTWREVKRTFECVPALCRGKASCDTKSCLCSSKPKAPLAQPITTMGKTISVTVERSGKEITLHMKDPIATDNPAKRPSAGSGRKLKATPVPTLSPYFLGAIVFLMSLCVIGTHGLLSGTATMDFGGRKGAATAVAMIDGFVYLGTAVESFSLGYLTTRSWSYWPLFLVPFGIVGFLFCLRIWKASPSPKRA